MKYGFQKQSFFLVLGCPVFKSIAVVVVQFRYFRSKDDSSRRRGCRRRSVPSRSRCLSRIRPWRIVVSRKCADQCSPHFEDSRLPRICNRSRLADHRTSRSDSSLSIRSICIPGFRSDRSDRSRCSGSGCLPCSPHFGICCFCMYWVPLASRSACLFGIRLASSCSRCRCICRPRSPQQNRMKSRRCIPARSTCWSLCCIVCPRRSGSLSCIRSFCIRCARTCSRARRFRGRSLHQGCKIIPLKVHPSRKLIFSPNPTPPMITQTYFFHMITQSMSLGDYIRYIIYPIPTHLFSRIGNPFFKQKMAYVKMGFSKNKKMGIKGNMGFKDGFS